jgi:hypothetical protein
MAAFSAGNFISDKHNTHKTAAFSTGKFFPCFSRTVLSGLQKNSLSVIVS